MKAGAAVFASGLLGSCEPSRSTGSASRETGTNEETAAGRLTARPRRGAGRSVAPGLTDLSGPGERPLLLYVPETYDRREPAPFMLALHGAGGDAERGIRHLADHADAAGLLLLAPSSRDRTWDVVFGEFGPDVKMIDEALGDVFARFAVDRTHIAIEGFSDGASYALSLGPTNGDLFTHVIAFSPGFRSPEDPLGLPPVFISHGRQDPVLPIDEASRSIVPALRDEGYEVTYEEFEGGHQVPREIAKAAVDWFLG